MLRINLLPGYVAERRIGTYVTLGFIGLFILVTGAMLCYNLLVQVPSQKLIEAQADTAEAGKATTDKLKAQAAQITASIGPIQEKVKFVNDVANYNVSWARLYSKVADYTDPKISYSDASVSGTTMSIQAHTPSTAEIARYLQAMYRDPDFTFVKIDQIPGWGTAYIWKYYLDGKLIGTSSLPNPGKGAAGLAAAGLAGNTGAGGPPPGFGGGGPPAGFGGGGGGAPGGFGGGGANAPKGERVYSITEVLADKINPFATPASKNLQIQRALQRVTKKQVQTDFNVTITATLTKAFQRPVMPGSPTGAAAGGGFRGGPPL